MLTLRESLRDMAERTESDPKADVYTCQSLRSFFQTEYTSQAYIQSSKLLDRYNSLKKSWKKRLL